MASFAWHCRGIAKSWRKPPSPLHAPGMLASACCALAVFRPVARPVQGAEPPHVFDELVDRLGQKLALGRRGPHQAEPVRLDAHRQHVCLIMANRRMAL